MVIRSPIISIIGAGRRAAIGGMRTRDYRADPPPATAALARMLQGSLADGVPPVTWPARPPWPAWVRPT